MWDSIKIPGNFVFRLLSIKHYVKFILHYSQGTNSKKQLYLDYMPKPLYHIYCPSTLFIQLKLENVYVLVIIFQRRLLLTSYVYSQKDL